MEDGSSKIYNLFSIIYSEEMDNTPNRKITVRRATPDDANLISVLGTTTFYEAYYRQDHPAALAEYIVDSFSIEQVKAELKDPASEFFLVFLDEKAVGYAKLRDDPNGLGVSSANAIELQRFYAVENVYGKGVGKMMLDLILDYARERGFDTLWLGVWEENKRGIRFYEKHGFRDTGGRQEFPYSVGIGINIVMEKRIPGL